MLRHETEINGYTIGASDGQLGTVCDFLFDDASWLVRWLVVDTGNWLSGRKVLLPPSVLGSVNHIGHQLAVKLTMQQVKDSPDIDTDRPVSRQMETNIYDYYGWNSVLGKRRLRRQLRLYGRGLPGRSRRPGHQRRVTVSRISAASESDCRCPAKP